MKTNPRSGLLAFLAVAGCILAIALPALAYQYPLSSTDIRNAYFIGIHNDELTAAFFANYTRNLSAPNTGPYVAEIDLDTPYLQVARRAAGAVNYDSLDAVQEFQDKPMVFHVNVQFFFTDTYRPSPLPYEGGIPLAQLVYPDFWNDFKVRLFQGSKEIHAKSIRGAPIYPSWGGGDGEGPPPLPMGGRIVVDYDPEKIDTADATVEVLTPDGQDIEVPFDLSSLR
jgi:hypothetical protein